MITNDDIEAFMPDDYTKDIRYDMCIAYIKKAKELCNSGDTEEYLDKALDAEEHMKFYEGNE